MFKIYDVVVAKNRRAVTARGKRQSVWNSSEWEANQLSAVPHDKPQATKIRRKGRDTTLEDRTVPTYFSSDEMVLIKRSPTLSLDLWEHQSLGRDAQREMALSNLVFTFIPKATPEKSSSNSFRWTEGK